MKSRGISHLDEETLAEIMADQKQKDSKTARKIDLLANYNKKIVDDIETFREEIMEQLRYKVRRYKMMHELQDNEIVKQRLPESLIMEKAMKQYENAILEREVAIKASDDSENYLRNLKNSTNRKGRRAEADNL